MRIISELTRIESNNITDKQAQYSLYITILFGQKYSIFKYQISIFKYHIQFH